VHTYALHPIGQQHFEGPVVEHVKSEHSPPGSEEQQKQHVSPVVDDSMPVLARLRHVYDFVYLQPFRSTGTSARQRGRNAAARRPGTSWGGIWGARRCYGPEAQLKGRTCSTNLPSTVRFSKPSMPGGRQPAPASRRSLYSASW